jgi:hypothetical protein
LSTRGSSLDCGPRLSEILGPHARDAEIADQAGLLELGQRAEVFGDRLQPTLPEVDEVVGTTSVAISRSSR